jgi:hypothetical protein
MYQIIITHLQNQTAQILEYPKLGDCLNRFREICDSIGYKYDWSEVLPTAGGIGHEYRIEVFINL